MTTQTNLKELISKLKKSFKSKITKEQVLDPEWLEINIKNKIDSTGFCFYASEVIYRLTGGKNVWLIKKIAKEVFPEGPHYFLQNKETKEILDITADQFTKLGINIPYEKGKGRGLQNISKSARKLANTIGHEL